jgi:hypothetical protein
VSNNLLQGTGDEPPSGRSRKRKFGCFCFWFITVLLAIVIMVDAWCEWRGLPRAFVDRFERGLAAEGFHVEIERMRAGIVRGIRLDGITVRDARVADRTLVTAEMMTVELDVTALLRRQLKPTRIDIRGGDSALALALVDPTATGTLAVTQLGVELLISDGAVQMRSAVCSIGAVQVTVQGRLIPPETLPKESPLVSLEPLLEGMTAGQRRVVVELAEFCNARRPTANAELSITFNIDVDDVSRSDLQATLIVSDFTYRHLNVDSLLIEAHLTADIMKIRKFRMVIDSGTTGSKDSRGDVVTGALELDLRSDEISGRLAYNAFPHAIVRAVQPKLSDALDHIDFGDTRPRGEVILQKSPLRQSEAWAYDLTLSVARARLFDAAIADVELAASVADGIADVKQLDLRLGEHANVKVHGQVLLDRNELIAHITYDGDPRELAPLYLKPDAREGFLKTWKDYTWNPATTRQFEYDLHRYYDDDGNLVLWIQGEVTFRNFRYKGLPMSRASGDFYIDFYNHCVVIDGLRLEQGSHGANAAMIYDLAPGRKRLVYSAVSGLPVEVLLGTISRPWRQAPAIWGLQFAEPPMVTLQGWHSLMDPDAYLATVNVDAGRFTVDDVALASGVAKLYFFDRRSLGSIEVDAANVAGWYLQNCQADVEFGETTRITGTLTRASNGTSVFGATRFRTDVAPDRLEIAAHSETVEMDKWRLADVRSENVIADNILESAASIARADCGDLVLKDVDTSFSRANRSTLVRHLQIGGLKLGSQLQAGGLALDGSVRDDGPLTFAGHAGTLIYSGAGIETANAAVALKWQPGRFDMKVSAPQATIGEIEQLDNPVVELQCTGAALEKIAGRGTCDRAEWRSGMVARGVASDFSIGAGAISHRSTWRDIEFGDWRLAEVATDGTLQPQNRFDVTAAHLYYEKKITLQDFSGDVTIGADGFEIDGIQTTWLGGQLTGRNTYNWETGTGTAKLGAQNVRYGRLLKGDAADEAGRLHGAIDVTMDLNSEKLQLTGAGNVMVRGGDFWGIPVLADFLGFLDKMFKTGQLAKITEFDSSLQFEGDRVYMPDLESNGELVAVRAGGYYSWPTRALDFRVKAVPLKRAQDLREAIKIPIIDPLVRKLTTLLDSRVTGTIDDPQWEYIEPIQKIFGLGFLTEIFDKNTPGGHGRGE